MTEDDDEVRHVRSIVANEQTVQEFVDWMLRSFEGYLGTMKEGEVEFLDVFVGLANLVTIILEDMTERKKLTPDAVAVFRDTFMANLYRMMGKMFQADMNFGMPMIVSQAGEKIVVDFLGRRVSAISMTVKTARQLAQDILEKAEAPPWEAR